MNVSALSLLVLRGLRANHHYFAFALDDLALVTHLLNRRSNFHNFIGFIHRMSNEQIYSFPKFY